MCYTTIHWRVLNIFARLFGLVSALAGLGFALWGLYFLIQPEAAGPRDILGFSPSFRYFVGAFFCLVIGFHFLRGKAHRPDLAEGDNAQPGAGEKARGWWTGEPLD